MPFNYSITNSQPKTGSRMALRRKERLKNMLADIFRHSLAGVGYRDAHLSTVQSRFNSQLTSVGHCVKSIDNYIRKNFTQLRRRRHHTSAFPKAQVYLVLD